MRAEIPEHPTTSRATGVPLSDSFISILLLAWTAGSFDAISYLTFTVFPANMTGNTVLLGIGIGTGQSEHVLHSGIALIAYCLGVLFAALIVGPDEKQDLWLRRLCISLAVEAIVILTFAAFWLFSGAKSTGGATLFLIILSALAMGMQSVSARSFGVAGIATTYITGTITSLFMEVAQWMRTGSFRKGTRELSEEVKGQRRQRLQQNIVTQGSVWLIYVIAATIAALTAIRLPILAVFLPLVAIVIVFLLAVVHHNIQ